MNTKAITSGVLEVLAFVGGALAALLIAMSFSAEASGNDVVCNVNYTAAIKGETARTCTKIVENLSDGGTVRGSIWGPGAVLLMQCSGPVYGSASSPRANNTFPDAGTGDFQYYFSQTVVDPVVLFLNSNQQDFTVIGNANDGGCRFAPYSRRN